MLNTPSLKKKTKQENKKNGRFFSLLATGDVEDWEENRFFAGQKNPSPKFYTTHFWQPL